MRLLTLEQILTLHAMCIKRFGGSQGLRNLGRLESIIATQTQEVFDEELYPGIYAKAAALCRGITTDHPFIDGNKRTGMLVALTFLKINRVGFTAKPGEIEDFAVRIATERLDAPVIAGWLEARAAK